MDLHACPWCGTEWAEGEESRTKSTARRHRCPACGQLWEEPVSARAATRSEFEAGLANCPHCNASLGPRDSRGPIAGGIARGIVGTCSMCARPFILQLS